MKERWTWKQGGGEVDVLAVGAHPDDVELGCGGTLALLRQRGLKVGIVHLTRGEAGTRGTADERRREAQEAATALRASTLDILDCGDGELRRGRAEEAELISLLRDRRPEMLLAPAPADRHPDHGRAYELVRAASFYCGLEARGEGSPHRPAALFSYMQHDPFDPSFIVDVSSAWEAKLAALAAYRSQLHQEGEERPEPLTKVASPEFRSAVEGRARHFGQLVGAAFGEPFLSPLPLAVSDPWQLLPGGLR